MSRLSCLTDRNCSTDGMHPEIFGITKLFPIERWPFSGLDLFHFGNNKVSFHFSETVLLGFPDNFTPIIHPLVGQIVIDFHIELRRQLPASIGIKTLTIFGPSHWTLIITVLDFLWTEFSAGLIFLLFRYKERPFSFIPFLVLELALHCCLLVIVVFIQSLCVIL